MDPSLTLTSGSRVSLDLQGTSQCCLPAVPDCLPLPSICFLCSATSVHPQARRGPGDPWWQQWALHQGAGYSQTDPKEGRGWFRKLPGKIPDSGRLLGVPQPTGGQRGQHPAAGRRARFWAKLLEVLPVCPPFSAEAGEANYHPGTCWAQDTATNHKGLAEAHCSQSPVSKPSRQRPWQGPGLKGHAQALTTMTAAGPWGLPQSACWWPPCRAS